jgi:flagellar motor switch/type III secretory pathway protein FliN
MAKRKIHVDCAQPRGVSQPPHRIRAKVPAAARKAISEVRQDLNEAAFSQRQALDSNTTVTLEKMSPDATSYLPSGFVGNLFVDLPSADPSATLVIFPNTCTSTTESVESSPRVSKPVAKRKPVVEQSSATEPMQQNPTDSKAEAVSVPAGENMEDALLYTRSLLKIHVSAAVVLAERSIPLEHVIHIAPGMILKFGKPHQQPLELEVGGRRIATGEAVTIGDRMGLRLTAMHS